MTKDKVDALMRKYGNGLEYEDGWEMLEDTLKSQSRWCTHWSKIVRHKSGYTVCINYTRNTGDGNSADTYKDEYFRVEGVRRLATMWRPKAW